MLIKAKTKLIDHQFKGDKEIFTHCQDNRPVMQQAKESRDDFNPNFMLDRPAWPVAKVPALLFKQFLDRDGHNIDWKAFDRWLNSEYGRPFKASK